MTFDFDSGFAGSSYEDSASSQGTSVSDDAARVDPLKAGKRLSPLMAAFRNQ